MNIQKVIIISLIVMGIFVALTKIGESQFIKIERDSNGKVIKSCECEMEKGGESGLESGRHHHGHKCGSCNKCGGSGYCHMCGGSGQIDGHQCSICNGTGRCFYCGGDGELWN